MMWLINSAFRNKTALLEYYGILQTTRKRGQTSYCLIYFLLFLSADKPSASSIKIDSTTIRPSTDASLKSIIRKSCYNRKAENIDI